MSKRKSNRSWIEDNLTKIEQLAAKTGKIKDIEELIGISYSTLLYYRRTNPMLEEAIQKGKLQYEIKCNLALDLKTIKKAPTELIASISSVEDTSEDALAAYRRKKIEEHECNLQRQVRNAFRYML